MTLKELLAKNAKVEKDREKSKAIEKAAKELVIEEEEEEEEEENKEELKQPIINTEIVEETPHVAEEKIEIPEEKPNIPEFVVTEDFVEIKPEQNEDDHPGQKPVNREYMVVEQIPEPEDED